MNEAGENVIHREFEVKVQEGEDEQRASDCLKAKDAHGGVEIKKTTVS